ncbi:MAG: hypothetical protein QG617_243, partial [Campylobacterota bacterium]|nr:hypothetical protein [Campylobacterota bacterium]
KLWIDANGDGATNTGELKTLAEMGVTSLALNSATPYIPTTEATNTNTVQIESYYNTNLNGGKIPTTAKTANATINMTPIYTSQLNSNYYTPKIFASNIKIDIRNNCFYMFGRKAVA